MPARGSRASSATLGTDAPGEGRSRAGGLSCTATPSPAAMTSTGRGARHQVSAAGLAGSGVKAHTASSFANASQCTLPSAHAAAKMPPLASAESATTELVPSRARNTSVSAPPLSRYTRSTPSAKPMAMSWPGVLVAIAVGLALRGSSS
eukprot:scaffold24337_cov26-Tisochrysis_lutea.AAC.3